MGLRKWAGFAAAVLGVACGASLPGGGKGGGGGARAARTPPPAPAPAPPPSPTAPPSVAPLGRFQFDWEGLRDGTRPPDFEVLVDAGGARPWLYDGGWRIEHPDGQPVLEVPDARTFPPEPLTFLRFQGTTFGAPGKLPDHFRVVAEGASLGGAARFGGYGELAMEVAYLAPDTYVEVLQTDRSLLLWQAVKAPPGTGAGWTLLASVPHAATVGQWVRFGAEVDRRAGTLTALLDDQAVATATPSLLSPGASPPAGLTLRATGNRERWRSLQIQELP